MNEGHRKSGLFRRRGESEDGKVSFIELFFDLVFVFTIIQLSHTMAHHFTPLGVAEALLMVLGVWWVWIYTTWAMNWLNPAHMSTRAMLFVMMFLGLVLSTSIPEAFGDRGLYFAGAYVAMQVGRTTFITLANRGFDDVRYRNFLRITLWLVFSGMFWIAGGFAHHEWRLLLWIAALAIEYAAPALGFWVPVLGLSESSTWNVSGAHMAERCALFVIICLGETILVTGRIFSESEWTGTLMTAFAISFLTTIALWWIYFRFGHERGAHLIEGAQDPGSVARAAYTYAHIPIVAGILVTAVAADFTLARPDALAGAGTAAALVGGPAIFMAGNLWFKGVISGRPPLSHIAGLLGLAVIFAASGFFSVLLLAAIVCVLLVAVAVWEYLSLASLRDAH
ncbi:MAG: low temperature requirement protein A [Hyphomicrobiales bacterium]|nr:low temperature requirement protein A [Rhodobiaceae bacterium]MCC0055189.1 low temperature requirement protein A [Rhodobiaceae bacterium]MCC2098684.1 low temperature requirement protein A [Hyphomicrobiales bacterium]